jgi:hypothetical protein
MFGRARLARESNHILAPWYAHDEVWCNTMKRLEHVLQLGEVVECRAFEHSRKIPVTVKWEHFDEVQVKVGQEPPEAGWIEKDDVFSWF